MPKKGFVNSTLRFFKRLFRARNIIVVSAHKVDHIPISAPMQALLVIGVVAGVSVFSYFAGNYAAVRAQVVEKERKLHVAEVAKTLMDKDFALLKRDLLKVKSNGKELNEYSKFILEQYTADSRKGPGAGQSKQMLAGDNKLFERVLYLEKRINAITTENAQLLYAIRERTEGKIDLFENIITTTGLNMGTLEHTVANLPTSRPARVSTARPKPADETSGQGGPFIPYGPTVFNKGEQALLGAVERLVRLNKIVNTLPIGLPILSYQERSGFGQRRDPFSGDMAFHPGLDMAGAFGAPVVAANDGVVTEAGRDGSYGNKVDIEHGLSLSTRYAHLSRVLVKEGERVKKGQVIGLEGSTGRSTGPHLHYEVRYHNHPIDPKKFLNARKVYVSQAQ